MKKKFYPCGNCGGLSVISDSKGSYCEECDCMDLLREVQFLGPIELDANGEASGDGWRVARGALYIDTTYASFDPRECIINGLLAEDPAVIENMCLDGWDRDAWLPALRRWCEQVGWFRGESPAEKRKHARGPAGSFELNPKPATLTCGPLRLERQDDDTYEWRSGSRTEAWLKVYTMVGALRLGGIKHVRVEAPSPTEAAQALAAAIEASTDPAVARFREEHWDGPILYPAEAVGRFASVKQMYERTERTLRVLSQAEVAQRDASRGLWDPVRAEEFWHAKVLDEETEENADLFAKWWIERKGDPSPALAALVLEVMHRWRYMPHEAERYASRLVDNLFAPLEFLRATPEEQVELCRARDEGDPWEVQLRRLQQTRVDPEAFWSRR